MNTLWIIGDSFSTSMNDDSWISIVAGDMEVINLAKNGVSEYRIYRTFLSVRGKFKENDIVIFCHTNPHRIYLPDRVAYPTRTKTSHPHCDLVMGDVSRHGIFWRFISYVFVSYFYDETYYDTLYYLMVQEMDRIQREAGCKVLHISGFDVSHPIISIYDLFLSHRGNINHLNKEGNILVAERILSYLE